jgi:hypothetical protein
MQDVGAMDYGDLSDIYTTEMLIEDLGALMAAFSFPQVAWGSDAFLAFNIEGTVTPTFADTSGFVAFYRLDDAADPQWASHRTIQFIAQGTKYLRTFTPLVGVPSAMTVPCYPGDVITIQSPSVLGSIEITF